MAATARSRPVVIFNLNSNSALGLKARLEGAAAQALRRSSLRRRALRVRRNDDRALRLKDSSASASRHCGRERLYQSLVRFSEASRKPAALNSARRNWSRRLGVPYALIASRRNVQIVRQRQRAGYEIAKHRRVGIGDFAEDQITETPRRRRAHRRQDIGRDGDGRALRASRTVEGIAPADGGIILRVRS